MSFKDLKYFLAYLAPLAAFAGLYFKGWMSPGSVYIGFVIIPIFELFSKGNSENLTVDQEEEKLSSPLFDYILYLNVPILFGLIGYFFYLLQQEVFSSSELVWACFNVGLMVGTIGINVAHELGHRQKPFERFLAKTLLMTALYMHFYIEHNRGHHKFVATPEDPSSARFKESLYAFWFRSTTQTWLKAWKLEKERLAKQGVFSMNFKNEMLRFQIIQLIYLLAIGFVFGWKVIPFAIAIAVIGFLLLETVNYIEHYGLQRKLLANGKYEIVQPWHSWNSNHDLGRIYLYELTRHSDHHYKANRKYQILRHFDESPQLPLGYPGSMITALVPPLWFKLMNPLISKLQVQSL